MMLAPCITMSSTAIKLIIGQYNDIIMGAIVSLITSLTIVYSIVYSDADQRKHQKSASLAFVRGIHRGTVNSTHKWPVTRKMFPFDDVIMINRTLSFRRNDFNNFASQCQDMVERNKYVFVSSKKSECKAFRLNSLWHSGAIWLFLSHSILD